MPIATNTQKETLAVAYGAAATHASLHTAAPGTTGASEVPAGVYARKPITWAAGGSDGVVTGSVTFDVPASTAITNAGLWTALTAGTFLDSVAAAYASQTSQGTLTVNFTYTQS